MSIINKLLKKLQLRKSNYQINLKTKKYNNNHNNQLNLYQKRFIQKKNSLKKYKNTKNR